MKIFKENEKWLSQVPAVELLVNMGYEFISSPDSYAERQCRTANVLLEGILRDQLKKINSINFRGGTYLFSEENIQTAIQKLKSVKFDGLLRTNEKLYDLMTLGTSLEQTIDGDSKSYNLNYIDWCTPSNNRFHVVVEYSVERSRSVETARPDIVLFVNGIPFCVIECKAPSVDVDEGVSQSIRNQRDDYIPKLFVYSQMVMAVNKNEALYSTVGAGKKFWNVWKEGALDEGNAECEKLHWLINKPLGERTGRKLAESLGFDEKSLVRDGDRLVTGQDRAIYALCRPERLLEIAWKFTVFDGGIKKIARYQQYFVVKSTLERVNKYDFDGGARRGGIVWHTQGSGKSLTMVMLAINLALDPRFDNPRIVLVTDRNDLDTQLKDTFVACGLETHKATSGRNLLELVAAKKSGIITTLIHKFDKAYSLKKFKDDSADIFVLVDESHRTQFGSFSTSMRQMFPNACYLGFTGTPLLKKEKNNFVKFGKLIEPHYSIAQAVEDGAVVPLLYEGRNVEITQNRDAIDKWFERHTQNLNEKQKADLKRKYARSEMLQKADQVVYMTAFDISEHYREHWQGTGFKAQLVAPSRATAVKYQEYLKEIGFVSSEIIMSAPDMRDGFEETDEEPSDEVVKFWDRMMKRYGTEEAYTSQIIAGFNNAEDPEILIVVSKLLTGFDSPRNTVMYLCKSLVEHTLLQAIARVNRIYDGKDFGYIVDYASVLGNLDKALTMYKSLEDFDEEDILNAINSIKDEVDKLPQKYSELWDLFGELKGTDDEEAFERLLADEQKRDEFYQLFRAYKKCLKIALSSDAFLFDVDDQMLKAYKFDFRRFQNLLYSVKMRYADVIDFKDYEDKIEKVVNDNIHASEVTQMNVPKCIIEKNEPAVFSSQAEYDVGSKSAAAQADAIAHATKRITSESMEYDKEFYKTFATLIQQVIDNFRAKRLSELAYLEKAKEVYNKVVNKIHDDVPEVLQGNEDAMAYYGDVKAIFKDHDMDKKEKEEIVADIAIEINKIVVNSHKVDLWNDDDAKKELENAIDDYLYDMVKGEKNIDLSLEQMDQIIKDTLNTARVRKSQ